MTSIASDEEHRFELEALISAQNERECCAPWGVKLYFDGDHDLCSRRLRHMQDSSSSLQEELSWTVSPLKPDEPRGAENAMGENSRAGEEHSEDEEEVYKWMQYCDKQLNVIRSAELDSVPSENVLVDLNSLQKSSTKLASSEYMNKSSTTNGSSTTATRLSFVPSPHRTARRRLSTSEFGFMRKPRRHSATSGTLCDYHKSESGRHSAGETQTTSPNNMSDIEQQQALLATLLKSTSVAAACCQQHRELFLDQTSPSSAPLGQRQSSGRALPGDSSSTPSYTQEEDTVELPLEKRLLENQLSKAQEDLQISERTIQRLKQRVSALENDAEQLQAHTFKREDFYKKEVARLQEEVDGMRDMLIEYKSKVNSRELSLTEALDSKDQLHESQMQELEARHQLVLDQTKEQLRANQIELGQVKDMLRTAEGDLIVARSEIESLSARLTDAQLVAQKRLAQVEADKQEELQKLTSDCAHLSQSIKKVSDAYEQLKKSKVSVEEATALEQAVGRLEAETARKDEAIARLEAQSEQLSLRYSETKQAAAESEIAAKLKAKMLEEQNEYIGALNRRLEAYKEEEAKMRGALAQALERVAQLQQQTEQLRRNSVPEAASREWNELRHEVMVLRSELVAKNNTLDTVLKTIEGLEADHKREEERRGAEARARLAEKDQLNQSFQAKLQALQTENDQLAAQTQLVERKYKDKSHECARLAGELEELKENMKSNIQRVLKSFN